MDRFQLAKKVRLETEFLELDKRPDQTLRNSADNNRDEIQGIRNRQSEIKEELKKVIDGERVIIGRRVQFENIVW